MADRNTVHVRKSNFNHRPVTDRIWNVTHHLLKHYLNITCTVPDERDSVAAWRCFSL